MDSSSPSPDQRLILAIISLVLWVVVFLIVVFSLIATPSTIFVTRVTSTTPYDNQAQHILYPLLMAGLLIFSVLVFALNALFYRKRADNAMRTEYPEEREQTVAPIASAVPLPQEDTTPIQRKARRVSRTTAALLFGLAVLVIAGGMLGSISLFTRFGMPGTRSNSSAVLVTRGGTWMYALPGDVISLIPKGAHDVASAEMDQALYLPLFYSDAQGVIHPGATTEVPTLQNGGVSADATTWTFHLRPHLVWSDGAPYDARDVDYTWKLWRNSKFDTARTLALNLISSTEVSADHLAITFHLKRPFAPFLSLWVDGLSAPLPSHHFSNMAHDSVLKSPENLNPEVVSGPFVMSESVPGDHYTLVRNPRYYRASEGLPYLDKVVFTIVPSLDAGLKQLQAGSLDASATLLDVHNFQKLQSLKDYTLVYPPVQSAFEALYFNFHNTVLASHPEVRQSMAMAVDQPIIIAEALQGLGNPLCTDHPSAYHPGYEPNPSCPVFDLAAANKLLDDNGWVKGPDGVRTRSGQRLEFEYSTSLANQPYRLDVETIIQRDFEQIGIKLDIENYPNDTFFHAFLPQGKASPPTGAISGRYDIVEFGNNLSYDPDDSGLFACNQVPPVDSNIDFYCNPTLDKLFTQEQSTTDPGVRQQIYEQIHQVYLAQFPFITLYSPTWFALAHKGTHNYLPGPYTGTYNIAEWWCDGGKCLPL
jgi:peptide/nickel transport system substrate-binding protein